MALMPAYFTNTRLDRKKSDKSSKTTKHDAWLMKQGLHPSQLASRKRVNTRWKQEYAESISVDRSNYVSTGMSGHKEACVNKSLMNKLHTESKEVRDEILYKASRCMPLYNKGGLQYATPDTDMATVGTKSRRG